MPAPESNKIHSKISKIFDPIMQKIEEDSLLLRYNKLTQLVSIIKANLANLIKKAEIYTEDKAAINQDKILDLKGDQSKKEITSAYLMIAEKIVSFIVNVTSEKEETIEELTRYFTDLYIKFRSDADDIMDLFLLKDEAERHAVIADLVKIKIDENHDKVVKKVSDKYVFSKENSEMQDIQLNEVAVLEDLFREKRNIQARSATLLKFS